MSHNEHISSIKNLKSFKSKYNDAFDLQKVDRDHVLPHLSSLFHIYISIISNQEEDNEKKEDNAEVLCLVLDCYRICLRDKTIFGDIANEELIDGLMYLTTFKCSISSDSRNVSCSAVRCLTNALHNNSRAVRDFLNLNGLTWLTNAISNGAQVVRNQIAISDSNAVTVSLQCSESVVMALSNGAIASVGIPGKYSGCPPESVPMEILYESFVSAACFSYRATPKFPGCGAVPDIPLPTPRADLVVEVFKVVYFFKAKGIVESNSSVCAGGPVEIDTSTPILPFHITDHLLHGLLVEILLQWNNFPADKGLHECQLHALQVLSVCPPGPEAFSSILEGIYGKRLAGPPAIPSNPSQQPDFSNESTRVGLSILLPFIRSLLRLLELQLFAVESVRGTRGEGDSTAALLIPVLGVLTSLANKSDAARYIIFRLIVSSSSAVETSSGDEQLSGKQNPGKSLGPKCQPVEFSLYSKLISIMTSLEPYSKRYTSELFFAMCNNDANLFVEVTGFGNAVALLQIKGLI